MGVRVADGREVLAVYSTLVDQIMYDGRGPRRGEFPVGLKAVLQFRTDGHIVGVAFNPDLFVCNRFQYIGDLLEDFDACRFDLCLAGIEQDAIDHIDRKAVAYLLNCDISLRDFILKRLGEFLLCTGQPFDFLFFRQPFLFQPSLVRFSGFQPLAFLLQTGCQLGLLLL